MALLVKTKITQMENLYKRKRKLKVRIVKEQPDIKNPRWIGY